MNKILKILCSILKITIGTKNPCTQKAKNNKLRQPVLFYKLKIEFFIFKL